MNRDLQEIPKFSDKWSYLYFEKGRIEQYQKSISYDYLDKRIPIPVETLSLLMLGPGTTVTHEAAKTISESRCTVAWVGENGVKLYGYAQASTYSARNLIRQAFCVVDTIERMRVVRMMYAMRFDEILESDLTLEQLRGKEGARVRAGYKQMSLEFGIPWTGRRYDQSSWGAGDPVNRALSAANSCLYGLCQAAVVSLGCSAGLGFVHTGKQMSFVYDIADLYKTEFTIPIAFETVKQGDSLVESRARHRCRDLFREKKLLRRIAEDIMRLLYGDINIREYDDIPEGFDVAVNY